MPETLKVETIAPHELGPSEQSLWGSFAGADALYESPYFQPAYTLAAGAVAPHSRVAVLRRGERIDGFLPFQRRAGLVQPLAAPLTDYHGVVARPGARIDLTEVVEKLRADEFRFSGLRTPDPSQVEGEVRAAMVADVSEGFDAYMAARKALHPRFFKDKARCERSLERDHGPLSFSFSREEEGVLDWIIALKRNQYRRTARHDIFACGWTEALLRQLVETAEPAFGPRFAVLRCGGRIIAAEMSLAAGPVCHLWFPVYDPDYARYAPGMLMTLHSVRGFAEEGGRLVDFGAEGEPYKAYFADPAAPALTGAVTGRGWRAACIRLAGQSTTSAAMRPLALAGQRLRRRFDVVAACETTRAGWLRGAAASLQAATRARNAVRSVCLGMTGGLCEVLPTVASVI